VKCRRGIKVFSLSIKEMILRPLSKKEKILSKDISSEKTKNQKSMTSLSMRLGLQPKLKMMWSLQMKV
jgi:hypothetical protein